MSKDHLSRTARNRIRYHEDGSDRAVARKYGMSVAEVREIRANAKPNHPVRLAAKERRTGPKRKPRLQPVAEFLAEDTPVLDASKIVVGSLHTEGGVSLPQPLR